MAPLAGSSVPRLPFSAAPAVVSGECQRHSTGHPAPQAALLAVEQSQSLAARGAAQKERSISADPRLETLVSPAVG